jgi:hypothetical protein
MSGRSCSTIALSCVRILRKPTCILVDDSGS